MTVPVCLISGVGPGTGSALARRFAEGGYRVAMLARSEERLAALEKELPNAKGYRCDVSDPTQVESVASAVERDLGSPNVVIHNAVGGTIGNFLEIDPAILNRNFQVNTMGLLYLARRFAKWSALERVRSLLRAIPRRGAVSLTVLPLRRPRPRSGFSRNHWRASWIQKACTSPMSPSTP